MPVSHIGLTVSHLPSSCSFFLAALQPLGYKFMGKQGNQIGLGIHEADFFICEETPGAKAGAAHIAFAAPDKAAVRNFYANALNAGGQSNGAPAVRNEKTGYFNAAVLDLDGNSIEVVYRNEQDRQDAGSVIEHSRGLAWKDDASQSVRDDGRSAVSATRTSPTSKAISPPSAAGRERAAPSMAARSPAPSMSRSISDSVIQKPQDNGDGAAKKIIGTLIGAAAGAAVAYAMSKTEHEGAHEEMAAWAIQQAQGALQSSSRANSPPKAAHAERQWIDDAPSERPQSQRTYSETTSSRRSSTPPQAIEDAPSRAPPSSSRRNYHQPTYQSVAPTGAPGYDGSEYSATKSQASTARPLPYSSKSQGSVSRSGAGKPASSFVSTYVPDFPGSDAGRRRSEGSVASSRHSDRFRQTTLTRRATSQVDGSYDDAWDHVPRREEHIDDDYDDLDTIAPSDSISQIGSSTSSRSRRHRSSGGSGGHHHRNSQSGHRDRSPDGRSTHSRRSHHSKAASRAPGHRSGGSRREAEDADPRPGSIVELDEDAEGSEEWYEEQGGYGGANAYAWATLEGRSQASASTARPGGNRERKDSALGGGGGKEEWIDISSQRQPRGSGGSQVDMPIRGLTGSMVNGESGGRASPAAEQASYRRSPPAGRKEEWIDISSQRQPRGSSGSQVDTPIRGITGSMVNGESGGRASPAAEPASYRSPPAGREEWIDISSQRQPRGGSGSQVDVPIRGITGSIVNGGGSGSSSGGSSSSAAEPASCRRSPPAGRKEEWIDISSQRQPRGSGGSQVDAPIRGITGSMVNGETGGRGSPAQSAGRKEEWIDISSQRQPRGSSGSQVDAPIRGITGSMVNGETVGRNGRGVAEYAY